jgi:hypothetical protein
LPIAKADGFGLLKNSGRLQPAKRQNFGSIEVQAHQSVGFVYGFAK